MVPGRNEKGNGGPAPGPCEERGMVNNEMPKRGEREREREKQRERESWTLGYGLYLTQVAQRMVLSLQCLVCFKS